MNRNAIGLVLETERLNHQISHLSEQECDQLPDLIAHTAELQAQAIAQYGEPLFHFVPQSWEQVSTMRRAMCNEQLRCEGFPQRSRRAFRGMFLMDGEYLRSDAVVLGIIAQIRGRMDARRARLMELRGAILRLAGLPPNANVMVSVVGGNPHLHDASAIVVQRIPRGQMAPLTRRIMIMPN